MRASVEMGGLLVGKLAPLRGTTVQSGIRKLPVQHGAYLNWKGLEGDQQADRRHHGGLDKALHHYPLEHYTWWRQRGVGAPELLKQPGAFGENVSTTGLCEADVCVGDQFVFGEALIEVSQARQPCWRLSAHFAQTDMAQRLQASGRTGWYYRVLRPGYIGSDASLQLRSRPNPQWPIARVLRVLYRDLHDWEALETLASTQRLSASCRALARRRIDSGAVEDWTLRLVLPRSVRA